MITATNFEFEEMSNDLENACVKITDEGNKKQIWLNINKAHDHIQEARVFLTRTQRTIEKLNPKVLEDEEIE